MASISIEEPTDEDFGIPQLIQRIEAIASISIEEPTENKNEDLGIAQLMIDDSQSQIMEANLPNWLYSPILRHLPTEIISYIFTLLDFSNFRVRLMKTRSQPSGWTATPLILGAVCKDWREIAWSTPSLWSSMVIHFSKSTINNTRITLVRDWLDRSSQLPLSIRISFTSMARLSSSLRTQLASLAEIIGQYSSRWYHFELSSPTKIARYFRAQDCHAPILNSLLLEMPGRTNFHPITCPRLQQVHFISAQPIRFPFNNLTHICAESMLLENCLKILQNTPLLVHAEIIEVYQPYSGSSYGRITLPLKSLKVAGRDVAFLFLHITCPALDNLIYDGDWSYLKADYIIPFLACSTQLRSFSVLKYNSNGHSEVMNILRAMPSTLIKLTLSQVYTMKDILDLLGMILSSQILHHLETLHYMGSMTTDLPVTLSDSIPLVNKAVPLRLVKLDFDSMPELPKSFFSRLTERGIIVNVSCNGIDLLRAQGQGIE